MNFGNFIKNLRMKKNQTLRNFCLEHGIDPGNHSKLERGILPPPKDEKKLKQLALSLGIREGSEDWKKYFDLALVGNGKIPDYIMEDKELVNKLPVFFRTIKGEKIDDEKLSKLIKLIREI